MRFALGIIPAYAGSTRHHPAFWLPYGDHPRIRGEHRLESGVLRDELRIIPAYAGSTDSLTFLGSKELGSSPHTRGAHLGRPTPSLRRRDHPRIRGEHNTDGMRINGVWGIIPAYAGSTYS